MPKSSVYGEISGLMEDTSKAIETKIASLVEKHTRSKKRGCHSSKTNSGLSFMERR